MNKTTLEALKLAKEALTGLTKNDSVNAYFADKRNKALAAIHEALAEPVCEHHIADARNKYIKDGYICIKCGTLFRAAFHAEPMKPSQLADASLEPVAVVEITYGREPECYVTGNIDNFPEGVFKLYAEPVQPVQEPVMDYERLTALREGEQNRAEDDYFNARPHNDTPTLREMFCQGFERGFRKGLKYAAPVDAKSIRAKALEEAAKWFEDEEHSLQPKKVAAAIRRLK